MGADGTNNKIFGLLGGGNNCNNPCGRRKRQAARIDTGEKVDTKFFGLFGGGNSNCGNNGYNQGYNNGYNRICQCSNLSKRDNYGREEARCQKPDHTGRTWCYSTSNSNCGDAVASNQYRGNPWSYQACRGYSG